MAISEKDTEAKSTGSSASSLHPPYLQMISEAITSIKDRTGSSQPAIAKFIEENYEKLLPPTFRKILSIQLKRFVKSEKLVKIKNSYKIPTVEKVKRSANPSSTEAAVKITDKKTKATKKTVEKAKKTKRLSQVKTPEGLKKVKTASKRGSAGVEKLKKNKAATPVKRKQGPNSLKSGLRSAKKAKK
ncbi:hypothetical protein ABFS83_04G010100 [Erythranthe nasuta]